jgi:hypothetical protein
MIFDCPIGTSIFGVLKIAFERLRDSRSSTRYYIIRVLVATSKPRDRKSEATGGSAASSCVPQHLGLISTTRRSKYNGKPFGRGFLPKKAVGSNLVPNNCPFSNVVSGLGVLMIIRWGHGSDGRTGFAVLISRFYDFYLIQNSVDYRGFPVDFFCSACCLSLIRNGCESGGSNNGLVQSRRWDMRRNILCRRSI